MLLSRSLVQPPRIFSTARWLRALAGFALAFGSLSARSEIPDEVFDGLKFIHYDLYDYSPEEQASWETSRYCRQSLRLNSGSVTLKEVFAVEEAQANLSAGSWFGAHFDLKDDRTREQEVGRLLADAQVRWNPNFALLATGSPDVRKDQGALGGGAMITSADRARYAVFRILDDHPFFTGKNPDRGVRDSAAWRFQSELRWASSEVSAWAAADLGTKSSIHFPRPLLDGRTDQVEQRSDVDFHLRWEPRASTRSGAALGLRGTVRLLESGLDQRNGWNQLRRAITYGRGYLLWPLKRGLKAYAVLLVANEHGHGLNQSRGFLYQRWDLGLRAAAVKEAGQFRFEGGYVAIHSKRSETGLASGLTPVSWGDKVYLSIQWLPTASFYLRFLISHQVATGSFGGMNGYAGATF